MKEKMLIWIASSLALTCLRQRTALGYSNPPQFPKRKRKMIPSRYHLDYGRFVLEDVLPPLKQAMFIPNKDSTSYEEPNDVSVLYTNCPDMIYKWLSDNVPSKPTILGFDTETTPKTPWLKNKIKFHGPATIQLATNTSCLVAHLTRSYNSRHSPPSTSLAPVLNDPTIIKVGVDIDRDLLDLYRWNPTMFQNARSRFDLGGIGAYQGTYSRVGLKTLVQAVLGLHIPKSKRLTISNWSRVPLSCPQIYYSARDAWASVAVLDRLASLHPHLFGIAALEEVMTEERSLREMHARASVRKIAKQTLKDMLQQYRQYAYLIGEDDPSLPILLKEEISRLHFIMHETAPDRPLAFDAEKLGILL